jgi:hypothetical protein
MVEIDRKKGIGIIIVIAAVVVGIFITFAVINSLIGRESRPEGTLISTDSFSHTSSFTCQGKLDLIQTPSGDYVLYFQDMTVETNGARVFLSDKTTFSSQFDDLGTHVLLGGLPYKYGNFTMSIPSSITIATYKTAVIVAAASLAIQGHADIV